MRSRRLFDKPGRRLPSLSPPVRPPYALRRRLGTETIQELISDYQSGATSPELVPRYQVSKGALLDILHEQGLAVRRMGLTPEEIEEALELRASGLTYAAIGGKLDTVGSTVCRALQAC